MFRRKFKAPFKTDYVITEAFQCGGVKYYQFDDAFNIPYERALHALTYYEELRMRCTREFLLAHCAAVENILGDAKRIHIGKLAQLNMQLKERLEWIMEPEVAYKLASVVFFDKNESPYAYDFKYAQKKIAHWKKHKGVHDFFLQKPVQGLIPFLKDCEVNLEIYSQVIEKMNRMHLASISTMLSEEQKQAGSVRDLLSRAEILPA